MEWCVSANLTHPTNDSKTYPSGRESRGTESLGPSTSPPASAISSTATGTSWARSRSRRSTPGLSTGARSPARAGPDGQGAVRRSSASATASCSIPPARMKVAYDSGVRNWFDPGADPEAARDDETRRFAGLHHQHAQGAGAPCPVAEPGSSAGWKTATRSGWPRF